MSEWFEEWFNSPYYHILYKEHDRHEAEGFIDHLVDHLNPAGDAKFLDVACGKGRHAIYLHKKGFEVTGIDLSPENIRQARWYSRPGLQFEVHDMREVFDPMAYDYALNLFTSFGFFDSSEAHIEAIRAISASLKFGGFLILDFLNPNQVRNQLKASEVKSLAGIDFHIRRHFEGRRIIKEIVFEAEGSTHSYVERVSMISKAEFFAYFAEVGLEVVHTYGDYTLAPQDEEVSPRLIFIAKK